MINLKRFLLVPFDDRAISNGELKLFTEDHLGRLIGQNDAGDLAGQLTAMIAATQTKYDAFAATLGTRTTAGADREGDTLAMNLALDSFLAKVRQREGRVKDKFGKPSPQYEQFFPQGLSAYTRATLENVESLMTHMVTKCTDYEVQLGTDMKDEFIAAKAAFLAARGGQTVQSGDVADSIREREEARDALADQLTDNLFFFGKFFRREPERLADVMDQSLLREDEAAPPPAPPVPPGP